MLCWRFEPRVQGRYLQRRQHNLLGTTKTSSITFVQGPKNILPGYRIGSGLQMTMPDENETKLPKILEILLQKTSILWNATLRTFKYCNFYRKSFQDLGLMQQIQMSVFWSKKMLELHAACKIVYLFCSKTVSIEISSIRT